MKEKIGLIIIWSVVVLVILVNGIFFLHGITKLFKQIIPSLKKITSARIERKIITKKKVEKISKKTVKKEKKEEIVTKEKIVKKEEKSKKKIKPEKEKKIKKQEKPKEKIESKEEIVDISPVKKKVVVKEGEVILFLDNFDDNDARNNLGGKTEAFGEGKGVCIDSLYYDMNIPNSHGDKSGEYSLRLSYDVSNQGNVSGFTSNLKGVDLSNYQYLSFWVKGSLGGEIFKIRIADGEIASEISIKSFLPRGLFPDWRRVIIPLKVFKSIKKWNEMEGSLKIVFDYESSFIKQGVIYIDEIVFE